MSSAEVSLEEGVVRSGEGLEGGARRQYYPGNLSSRKAVRDNGTKHCSSLIPSHATHNTGYAKHSPTLPISPLFGMIKVAPSRVSLNPALLACVKSAVTCLLMSSIQYLKGWAQLCTPQSWALQRKQGSEQYFTFHLGLLGVLLGDLHRHGLDF